MQRFVMSIVALGLVAVMSMAAPRLSTTLAQESTTETPTPSGVVFEPVTGESAPPLVAEGADIRLERARFSPDAAYTIPADNAELLLVTVASGTLTVTSSTPLVINRAGEGTASTGVQEWVAADTDITLERGDSFVRPARSKQELRNEGDEPAVALMASIPGVQVDGQSASPDTSGGLVIALAVVVVPECEEGYDPVEVAPAATPGGGGGGGGAGGVAVAIAAAPECVGTAVGGAAAAAGTPTP